eukprot:12353008-Alexandrium_andersonii.AAC.1
MSASLVGSEMCIRDRDYESAFDRVAPWTLAALWVARGVPAWLASSVAGCLLYTSDAADDM